MEFNKVNFELVQECLSECESKEDMLKIFIASAASLLDSELRVLKADDLPGVLKGMPTALNISNEKAVWLILSLHNLLKIYLANDEQTVLENFPEKFNKKMRTVLFKMMREVAEVSKRHY